MRRIFATLAGIALATGVMVPSQALENTNTEPPSSQITVGSVMVSSAHQQDRKIAVLDDESKLNKVIVADAQGQQSETRESALNQWGSHKIIWLAGSGLIFAALIMARSIRRASQES